MKRIAGLLSVCLLLSGLMVLPLSGLDGGLSLDNATGFTQDMNAANSLFALSQRDKLAFWLDHYFAERLQLFIQGSYVFSLDKPLLFDLDNLYLKNDVPFAGEGNGLYSWQVGRFMLAEFSGYVLAHRVDGAAVDFKLPVLSIRLAGGYTGLLLKDNSDILLSQSDLSNASKEGVFFAPPRLIGLAQFEFPELIARGNVAVALLIQQDLWDSGTLTAEGATIKVPGQGGKLNTQYLGVSMSGPLVVPFYFDTFAYLGTGSMLSYVDATGSGTPAYANKFLVSGLGGLGLKFYLEHLYQTAAFNFIFATGDNDYTADFYEGNTADLANTFVPLSRKKSGLVFSPVFGNLALLELSYALQPFSRAGVPLLENLQALAKGLVFFRTSTGVISETTGLNPLASTPYLGTEIDLTFNYRPLSDLGVALAWGLFFPNNTAETGAFLPEGKAVNMKALLEISMAF